MEAGPPGGRETRRVVVASYGSYPEAQEAVDHLSDRMFPVERVAIVAEDLRLVEQITGRRGYGQAAVEAALSGAVIGILFGFILGLFNLIDPLVSALVLAFWGLIIGAILGAIVGLISHALAGGQRDFSSIGGMQAGRYNVMADEEVAEEATRLLAELRTPPGDARRETAPDYPRRPREEATPPAEIPPETPKTGEVPPREGPAPREAPPPGEEQPRRPREGRSPRADEERPSPPPPPPPSPPS